MKKKEYHFSLGNSSEGSIGFCAVVSATSKKAALATLKCALPEQMEVFVDHSEDPDVEYINVYFNTDAITEKDAG